MNVTAGTRRQKLELGFNQVIHTLYYSKKGGYAPLIMLYHIIRFKSSFHKLLKGFEISNGDLYCYLKSLTCLYKCSKQLQMTTTATEGFLLSANYLLQNLKPHELDLKQDC